ncbi:hypothetical protein KAT92_00600 [Candidatus Babeliales bacterium]|nr:hypothetical protein [Candidatus Babeliales bacterium]
MMFRKSAFWAFALCVSTFAGRAQDATYTRRLDQMFSIAKGLAYYSAAWPSAVNEVKWLYENRNLATPEQIFSQNAEIPRIDVDENDLTTDINMLPVSLFGVLNYMSMWLGLSYSEPVLEGSDDAAARAMHNDIKAMLIDVKELPEGAKPLPDEFPSRGSAVRIGYDEGGVRKFLMVDEEGYLRPGGTDPFGEQNLFTLLRLDTKIGFQSKFVDNKNLQTTDLNQYVKINNLKPVDLLASLRDTKTRAKFARIAFAGLADTPEQFYITPLETGGYVLKNLATEGYLTRVGEYFRTQDINITKFIDGDDEYEKYPDGKFNPLIIEDGALTVFVEGLSAVEVSLVAIRQITQASVRIAEYEKTLENILSSADIKLCVFEVVRFVKDAQGNGSLLRGLRQSQEAFQILLNNINVRFPTTMSDPSFLQEVELRCAELFLSIPRSDWTGLTGITWQSISSGFFVVMQSTDIEEVYFQGLSYPEKITDIVSYSKGLTRENVKMFIDHIDDITKPEPLIEAFVQDLDQLRAVLRDIEWNTIFIEFEYFANKADADDWRNSILGKLDSVVPYESLMDDLENMLLDGELSTVKEKQDLFIKKANRLFEKRVDGKAAQVDEFEIMLRKTLTAQFKDRPVELQGIIDKLTTYVERVRRLTSFLEGKGVLNSVEVDVFWRKVDSLVGDLDRAKQERFDLEKLVSLLNAVKAKFFQRDLNNAEKIDSAMRTLRGDIPYSEMTFGQKVESLEGRFPYLVASEFADFVTALQDLVLDQISGVSQDITLLTELVRRSQSLLEGQMLTKAYALQDGITSSEATRVLEDLLARLEAGVNFETIFNELEKEYNSSELTADRFLALAQQLVGKRTTVTSSQKREGAVETLLEEAIGLLQKAADIKLYTRRTELLGMVAMLEKYRKVAIEEGFLTYAKRLDDLERRLATLDEVADVDAAIKTFMSDLQKLVDERLDATPEEIIRAKRLLYAVSYNTPIISYHESKVLDLQSIIADIQRDIEVAVTFGDWFGYLQVLYNELEVQVEPDPATQNRFAQKSSELFKRVNEASRQQLSDAISLLNKARFNDSIINISELAAAIGGVAENLSERLGVAQVTYGQEIKALRDSLVNLTDANIQTFMNILVGLVARRVEGTNEELLGPNGLQVWLKSNAVKGSDVIYLGGRLEIIEKLTQELEEPLPYKDILDNVVTMLRDNQAFDEDQKNRFLAKAERLRSGRNRAASAGIELSEVEGYLQFALDNRFDKGTGEYNQLENKLVEWYIFETVAIEKTYSERINELNMELADLEEKINLEVTATGKVNIVDGFIKKLSGVIFDKLDGSAADIKVIEELVTATRWNRGITSVFALEIWTGDNIEIVIAQLREKLVKVVTFQDWYTYLNNFIEKVETDEHQKKFVDKAKSLAVLYETAELGTLELAVELLNTAAFNKVSDYKTQLVEIVAILNSRLELLQRGIIELTFAERIEQLGSQLSTLGQDDVGIFKAKLKSLVDSRLDSTDDDVEDLKDLIIATQWNEGVISFYKSRQAAAEAMAPLLVKLEAEITYQERHDDLSALLSKTELNDKEQQRFVNKAELLVALRNKADIVQLENTVEQLQWARFNRVLIPEHQAKLGSLIETLQGRITELGKPVISEERPFGQRVTDLGLMVDKLTLGTVPGFFGELDWLTKNRVQGTNDDINRLKQLVERARYHRVFDDYEMLDTTGKPRTYPGDYPDINLAGQILLVDGYFDIIVTTLSQEVSFEERLFDLNEMLQEDSLPLMAQVAFVQKAKQMVARRNSISPEQREGLIAQATETLKTASLYQLASRKSDLVGLIGTLESGAGTFAQRVDTVDAWIDSLTVNDVKNFGSELEALVGIRVQGTTADIEQLKNVLDRAMYHQFFRGIETDGYNEGRFREFLSTLDESVPFAVQLIYLEDILKNEVLSSDERAVFMAKARELVVARTSVRRADAEQVNDAAKALRTAAYYQLKVNANELASLATKLEQQYEQLAREGDLGALSYGARVSALGADLGAIGIDQENIKDAQIFVADLKELVGDQVQGLKAEIEAVVELIKQKARWHPLVKTIEKTLFDPDKLLADLEAGVSFEKHAEYIKSLITTKNVFSDRDKKLFLEKVSWLSEHKDESGPTDDSVLKKAAIESLLTTLFTAYSYQMDSGSDKSALEPYIEGFERYFDTVGLKPKTYRERIVDVKDRLKEVDWDSVKIYVEDLARLVDERVDGVEDDVEVLRDWLTDAAPGYPRATDVIFLGDSLNILDELVVRIDEPVVYTDRVKNLVNFIKDNPTFSANDGNVFLSKLKILVDKRWRAAEERFDLTYIEKLVEFVLFNRLQGYEFSTTRAYANQYLTQLKKPYSGVRGEEERPSYSDRIKSLKNMLPGLSLYTWRNFLDAVRGLVEDRADAIDMELFGYKDISFQDKEKYEGKLNEWLSFGYEADLKGWLKSDEVQKHESLIVVSSGNVEKVESYKKELNTSINMIDTPIPYNNLVSNLRDMLWIHDTFGRYERSTFVGKVERLARERGRADLEGKNVNEAIDLITTAIRTRFAGYSSDIDVLEDKITELGTKGEVQALETYAQRIAELRMLFDRMVAQPVVTVSMFIDGVERLGQDRVDGTQPEIDGVYEWLVSDYVQYADEILYLDDPNEKKRLKDSVELFNKPVSYAERISNLTSMLKSNPTLDVTQTGIFFEKAKTIRDERWRAQDEGVSLEDLHTLWMAASKKQFAGDFDLAEKIAGYAKELLITMPRPAGEEALFVSFADRLRAKKNELVGYTFEDQFKDDVARFVENLKELVADRVDATEEDLTAFKEFLETKVLAHEHIAGKALESVVNLQILAKIETPPTFQELVDNLAKLLDVQVFSNEHKEVFVVKLKNIVEKRYLASTEQRAAVQSLVRRARGYRFRPDDSSMVDGIAKSYISQIDSLLEEFGKAGEMTLDVYLKQQEEYLNKFRPTNPDGTVNNNAEKNLAALTPTDKAELLTRLRKLVNNVDASTTDVQVNDINGLLLMAKARIFKSLFDDVYPGNQESREKIVGYIKDLETYAETAQEPQETVPAT